MNILSNIQQPLASSSCEYLVFCSIEQLAGITFLEVRNHGCFMEKFLEKYNLPKLNEKEAESLNRLIPASEIEVVIKNKQTNKKLLAHKIP